MRFRLSFFFLQVFFNARAADTNPPPRLTVELRDGSRVDRRPALKNISNFTPRCSVI
jgi:hypothetical protein